VDALLSVEHVGKTDRVGPYEQRVLVDVSLTVTPGRLCGVWGGRRAGKSTLLRIAAGLEPPDTGTVRIDGQDLAELSTEARARLRLGPIGLVHRAGPQSESLTVLGYVALPLLSRFNEREARRRALAMLRRLDIADCCDALWMQLSDGEKALVRLAHGLVREPRLLLVDDPVAGLLDTLQRQEVLDVLRTSAIGERIAVLMTSSVLAAVVEADEAFTLSDGRLMPVTDVARPDAEVIEFPRGRQLG
jgi:ABC-type multidrug transport system ATPase subunit